MTSLITFSNFDVVNFFFFNNFDLSFEKFWKNILYFYSFWRIKEKLCAFDFLRDFKYYAFTNIYISIVYIYI